MKMRVIIEPGFYLILAAAVAMFGVEYAVLVLLAALLHEGGHIAAIRLTGGRITEMRAGAGGFRITTLPGTTYPKEIAAAAAGPLVSLVAALLFAHGQREWTMFFSGVNLVFFLANMIPVSYLDGGKVFYLFMSWMANPYLAGKIANVADRLLLALFFALGVYSLLRYRNPTLLICCTLLIKECCKSRENSVE